MKYHFILNLITGHNISFPEPAVKVMQFLSTDEYAVLRNINIYCLDHLRNYCQSLSQNINDQNKVNPIQGWYTCDLA